MGEPFWTDGFWDPHFWAPGFWDEFKEIFEPPIEIQFISGGGGGRRKRREVVVARRSAADLLLDGIEDTLVEAFRNPVEARVGINVQPGIDAALQPLLESAPQYADFARRVAEIRAAVAAHEEAMRRKQLDEDEADLALLL